MYLTTRNPTIQILFQVFEETGKQILVSCETL